MTTPVFVAQNAVQRPALLDIYFTAGDSFVMPWTANLDLTSYQIESKITWRTGEAVFDIVPVDLANGQFKTELPKSESLLVPKHDNRWNPVTWSLVFTAPIPVQGEDAVRTVVAGDVYT